MTNKIICLLQFVEGEFIQLLAFGNCGLESHTHQILQQTHKIPYLSYEYHNCQFKPLKSCHYLCENLVMVNVASDTGNYQNKTNKKG